MIINYFDDTDTLYIELNENDVEETTEVDIDTYLDKDKQGQVVAITIEHASGRTDLNEFVIKGTAA